MLECCLRIGFFFKLSFHIKTAVLVTYQSEQFTPSLKAYQAEFKYFTVVGFDKTSTVRLGSLDPFYIVSYYIKWAKTSWSYRMYGTIITFLCPKKIFFQEKDIVFIVLGKK